MPINPRELGNTGIPDYGIWDVHCHPNMPGDTPSKSMENLVRYADRMGVERLVIYMVHPWYRSPTPEQFRRSNDGILAMLKDWSSRAVGFAYLNPKYPEESMAEIERCVANGPMVGIKLWTAWQVNRPELDPIVERATQLKAAIFQHTWIKAAGNDGPESTPEMLVELSKRHPGMRMICGHTGGNWELGIRTIRGQRELFSDIAGSEPTAGLVEMAVRELGAERVIYGSDVTGRAFASQIAKVMSADISAHDKRLVLRENLRNLLLPIMREKGIPG